MDQVNPLGHESVAHRNKRYWWVLLAILVIISLTIFSIVWLKGYASKAQTAETRLLTIHQLANEQNATEWQAIALQDFNKPLL